LAQNELNLESNGFDAEKGRIEDAESKQTRGTHSLESADRWTSQDTGRIKLSKGHSLPGECRWTDKSGHEKNLTK